MANFEPWDPAAGVPPLPVDRVQVWRLDLNQDPAIVERLAPLLSADERARAGRFYFPHLRAHYTLVRGALRILLGELTGRAPAALEFAYAQYGKPLLRDSELQFNVSHSGERALIAIAHGRTLGVDIERLRPLRDGEAIARRFFAPAEVDEFLAVPVDLRAEAFYNGWTRKEAFIKAIGDGLAYPLDRFVVSLAPGAPARLHSIDSDAKMAQRWNLVALDPGNGYAGALVAEGPDWEPECRELGFDHLRKV